MSSDTDIDFDTIPPSAHLARPGGLQGDVWLTLQTYQAQALIRGRRAEEGKPVIVGLLGFAERLRTLWQAARMDDPYADWWLLKVEEGIAGSRAQLCRLQQLLEALIASAEGLEVSIAHSERPQRVSLQFANPYAFRAAQLLADYDQVVCTAMTLRHVGMTIPDALLDQLKGSGRWVRRVLALPQGYQSLGISRKDVAQGTPSVNRARERMGEVPMEVLQGDRLPSLRPTKFPQSGEQDHDPLVET
ncbi:TIGR03761 family integrating conjugative element protein [Aestuariicella hydrocarbonica]|uniref:TIGR03761 family integrating conjugative element protein n=1 Tax=Pseudomaricurvus hydrocarbonicus TaxID=1470433 RepID=A0A9E5MMR3_9GAMM|nr:TIGR03761 family integrating conjugative element protein [Aestuariicella hydrocarbonica]NHO67077.1 TIGR03761 family integrating conjugative element protein [Aestuariicella hydrocarbonica]